MIRWACRNSETDVVMEAAGTWNRVGAPSISQGLCDVPQLRPTLSYSSPGFLFPSQIAAVFCVCNLLRSEEEGALERQAKLREMGIQRLLQQLLTTQDTVLFDKV